MYLIIKHLHMTVALISIIGFIVRGPLAITQHSLMQQKLIRILPHVIDTILLVAGIYLAWVIQTHPFNSPWILAKVIGLLVYIFLGTLVIKRKGSVTMQWSAYILAILVFAYIVTVAMTKNPWIVF